MPLGDASSFSIAGMGARFADRQRDLFASLDAAEKERESRPPTEPLPIQDDDRDDRDRDRPDRLDRRRRPPFKQFRGKESIFKRPEMPAPRRAMARHSVPDHQRNPHKYTKYSLGDVSSQDMSDRTNTAAALSFLQELKSRKDQMDSDELPNAGELPKSIIFKSSRPKGERRTTSLGSVSTVTAMDTSEEADRPSFRSSKVVMPEYVVGQKKASKKKLNPTSKASDEATKKTRTKEISLGHLMDEEDE